MERLMELARMAAEQVEVYAQDTKTDGVSFENARLKDIDSKLQSGVRLTLLARGRLGSAYTRNLLDREGLVQNALASLSVGTEAGYELPATKDVPALASCDPGIEKVTNTQMTDECARICAALAPRVKGQVNVSAGRATTRVRVLNSRGTDLAADVSSYFCYAAVYFPGSYSSVHRVVSARGFAPMPDDDLDFIAETYNAAEKEVKAKSGPTRVLFLPEAMYALLWRLSAATSGKAVYEKVSPLTGRKGEKLFSELLTVSDEPLDDTRPGARAFDDEGTVCRSMKLVEAGRLSGYYCDRYYAWKLGGEPTGHGYRSGIEAKAVPTLEHLVIKPGEASLERLIGMMDSGIIVSSVLGAHSGNILNGDYSIGLSPGFCVEKGKVIGHVKDAMVAGNIYDTLKNVVAVGDRLFPAHLGWFPALLLDGVNFAAKG